MNRRKKIAIVAHKDKKQDLVVWARANRGLLTQHELYATGVAGATLEQQLGMEVHRLQRGEVLQWSVSDRAERRSRVDLLIFFWNQAQLLPHDPDERAILRLAALWNIPIACNRATADCMIPSLTQPAGLAGLSVVPR